MTPAPEILVIKLSALGDFVQAFPAFARIRSAHPGARITLLTTPPYADLARASPFFDHVETDGRPKGPSGAFALIRRTRARRYHRVYDLQGNDRTQWLFQTLRPFPPPWSGVAFGCALRHVNPGRMRMHTLERHAEQLAAAGIWPDAPINPGSAPRPDVSWMIRLAGPLPPEVSAPSEPLALLVPGAAPSRPAKRWPATNYAELARRLSQLGLTVCLVGGPAEADLAAAIRADAPRSINLVGRTDLLALAALGARAALAIGNDTGPLHIIAAAGAPTVALFSGVSDPALCAPRGEVTILRQARLADLPVEAVLGAVERQLGRRASGSSSSNLTYGD